MMGVIDRTRGIWGTYALIRRLSILDGPDVEQTLLDRVMYNSETLPLLGKEYWWFLFFGQSGEKPAQVMSLIFRKHGKRMLFNDKEITLRNWGKNKFKAVTAGWVYDGKRLHDLGYTNAVTEIQEKRIVSEISGQEMVLTGGFPDYRLKIGNTVDLDIKKPNSLEDKEARGVFIPPFGVGWVNVFSEADGIVLGETFKGAAHLQKVIGITAFGPFHWGRIIFQNDSQASFFCLKTGKDSRRYFRASLKFCDQKNNQIIKFHSPKLKISRVDTLWVVEGKDHDKDFVVVLEPYARKQFTMKSGGSQVYTEYAVKPRELRLETKDQVVTMDELGDGVGTFEDAYW